MASIVIMEDDTLFADLVGQTLATAGHEVTLAQTGAEALELVKHRKIDLVIVDILIKIQGQLVPEGGLLFLTRLRQQLPTRPFATPADIPAIAMSGAVNNPWNKDLLQTAQSFGANEVLGKPFPPARLLEAVERLLAETSSDQR